MTLFSMRVAGFVLAGCLLSTAVARAATESVVYAFQGGSDGALPAADLINVGGTLWGTTQQGSADNCGTVFSVTPAGAEKVVYAFGDGSGGCSPYAGLTEMGGILYGTAVLGGERGGGTVYSVTRQGAGKVLYSFPASGDPLGGLIHVHGVLYGTTATGGDENCNHGHGCGTAFSLTAAGTLTELYFFHGKDGFLPNSRLLYMGGTLYGTAAEGGEHACDGRIKCGTVFSVSPSGGGKLVYPFKGGSDGLGPSADLIRLGGVLYGTTASGGGTGCSGYGCGTVFSVTTTRVENIMYSFQGGGDGAYPHAGLINVHGTFYGTTAGGGSGSCSINGITGCGTVFSVTPEGVETVVDSFQGGSDGADPLASLIEVGGTLYGTTEFGGGTGCGGNGCGTVFAITP